jgi:Raf kinase inhibitor-like YbhB/YbcL family protein
MEEVVGSIPTGSTNVPSHDVRIGTRDSRGGAVIAAVLGRLLRGVRAGEEKLLWNDPVVRCAPETLLLSSPAFQDGGVMPDKYAARAIGGDGQSPPLSWANVPPDAIELVLVMEDPDAPLPTPSLHLLAVSISPRTGGSAPGELNGSPPSQVRFGHWLLGRAAYRGPMPPPSHGPHRYVFQMFALEKALSAGVSFNRKALLREIDGKILARGRLTGTFERK